MAEPPPIPPEDVAAEVAAAVEAVKGAKPIGSDLCLDAVRRLRQLLSNYDEPPFKEAVQGGQAGGCRSSLKREGWCLFWALVAGCPRRRSSSASQHGMRWVA